MKQPNKISVLDSNYNAFSNNYLLFSSVQSYVGKVTLSNPDHYIFYIFVGSVFNLSTMVHESVLEGNSTALASYYGRDLFTYITDRKYSRSLLRSFVVDTSGVKRIYGVK